SIAHDVVCGDAPVNADVFLPLVEWDRFLRGRVLEEDPKTAAKGLAPKQAAPKTSVNRATSVTATRSQILVFLATAEAKKPTARCPRRHGPLYRSRWGIGAGSD